MAHFAQLDENNIVINVIVINNDVLLDERGIEQELYGILFCKTTFGVNTKWIQTSYNGNFRKIYAGVGCFYDEQRDAFFPPQSEDPSFIFNEIRWRWEPPGYPEDGQEYYWDFENLSWKLLTF